MSRRRTRNPPYSLSVEVPDIDQAFRRAGELSRTSDVVMTDLATGRRVGTIPRGSRLGRNPSHQGERMSTAVNPWAFRSKRTGKFTKRRKGARRVWVGAAKAKAKRPAKRKAAPRKKKTAAKRPWWWGRRVGGRKPASLVTVRRRSYTDARGRRRKVGKSAGSIARAYGPQLPTVGQRRASAKKAGGRKAGGSGQLGFLFASNPRRRRTMRALTVNPKKRRRGPRGTRYRRIPRGQRYTSNPGSGRGIGQLVKNTFVPGIAGMAGGAAAGIIDTKILPKKILLQNLAKFAGAIGGAVILKKRPIAAAAWAGSLIGTIGYGLGVKLGGGLVANTKGDALKGLADMAAEDPELAGLLADSEDLADLVTAGDLADGEVELADDDDMADLVPADDLADDDEMADLVEDE